MSSAAARLTPSTRYAVTVTLSKRPCGSMVMLAKGNRSAEVRKACAKHGGFYLGSIGGPAARLAQDCIRRVEVHEFPELGWKP
jgi:tartrate dehydratase beta subunit/fumarate hydratase class I family protein